MKYRKDITIFIWELLYGKPTLKNHKSAPNKNYKVYVNDCGMAYMANYFYEDKNRISHYTDYSLYGITPEMMRQTEEKFKIAFAAPDDRIVCRCGEKYSFSAFYGSYELILKCEKCLNQFSAYSG